MKWYRIFDRSMDNS